MKGDHWVRMKDIVVLTIIQYSKNTEVNIKNNSSLLGSINFIFRPGTDGSISLLLPYELNYIKGFVRLFNILWSSYCSPTHHVNLTF